MVASYTNPIQNQWRLDLSSDNATWSQLLGVTTGDYPGIVPGKKDASSYDNQGWGTSTVTSYTWVLNVEFYYSVQSGLMTPAVTLLQNAVGQFGATNMVYAQWYRTDGVTPVEGWTGRGIVDLQSKSTNWDDIRAGKLVLTGSGSATKLLTLPANYTSSAPVITSASPSDAGTGALVELNGSGFTGATGVTVGGTAVTAFDVISDQVLEIELQSGTAGSAPIVVTTAAGASNSFAYTRAA